LVASTDFSCKNFCDSVARLRPLPILTPVIRRMVLCTPRLCIGKSRPSQKKKNQYGYQVAVY
jgi:hypothetical protein